MKKGILKAFPLAVFLMAWAPRSAPQDFPEQRPKFDYMSTFLRGRKPLGLKEDLIMKRLHKPPRASWAIRAGSRHILD